MTENDLLCRHVCICSESFPRVLAHLLSIYYEQDDIFILTVTFNALILRSDEHRHCERTKGQLSVKLPSIDCKCTSILGDGTVLGLSR